MHALRDVSFHIEGFRFGHLQIIILLSAVARIPSILLLGLVSDRSSISSRHLLSHLFRGNLLSYTFNTAVYTMARQEQRRARAALALARSGSPLAIEQLMQALADASPVVRRSAARALGETGSAEATDSLVRELLDGESDGSATRAASTSCSRLSRTETPGADQRHSRPERDRRRRGARALVLALRRASGRPGRLPHPRGRPQPHGRPRRRAPDPAAARRLRRLSSSLARSPAFEAEVRERTRRAIQDMSRALDTEDLDRMEESARQVAGMVRDGLSATGRPTLPGLVRLPRDPRSGDLPDQPRTLRSEGRTGDLRRRLSGAHWRDPSEAGFAASTGTAGSGGLTLSAWSPAAEGSVPECGWGRHRCIRRMRLSSRRLRKLPDSGRNRLSGSSRQRTGMRATECPARVASSKISTSNM